MWVGTSGKLRKKRGWSKKQIGSEIDNPFYDEDFAGKIAHLASLDDTFILTYISPEEQKAKGLDGGFLSTEEEGVYEIIYGEMGEVQGGNRFNALYEEVFHAWSFTKGYFGATTRGEDGRFRIANYDVYDEVDAKIYSLRAGGYKRTVDRVQGGDIIKYPTEMGIMKSDRSIEEKARYLLEEIEEEVTVIRNAQSDYPQKETRVLSIGGGHYTSMFSGDNRKKRFYNQVKSKTITDNGVQMYPKK